MDLPQPSGGNVHVSLLPNPSHLEVTNNRNIHSIYHFVGSFIASRSALAPILPSGFQFHVGTYVLDSVENI